MMNKTEHLAFDSTTESQMEDSVPFTQQFFTVIFIIVGFVGALGNTLVCVVIASTMARSKTGNTNLLILHQAFVDDITSFVLILSYTLPYPSIPKAGGWAEFICRMWVAESLLWMLFVVSTFNLCMMSLERFIAVAYPMIYSTKFNKRTSILMILFCWVIAPLLHYYYPVGDAYADEGVCKSHGDQLVLAAVGIMVFFWEFFIPFVFMAFVYARIVFLLRKQQLRVHASNASNVHQGRQDEQPSVQSKPQSHLMVLPVESASRSDDASTDSSVGNNRLQVNSSQLQQQQQRRQAPTQTVRRNVTVTLLAVFIMYVVCWMPNHLTFLQHGFGGPLDYAGIWFNITLVLAYLNMSINPFIYALKYKPFREGFRKLFCCSRFSRFGGRNMVQRSTTMTTSPCPPPTISGSERS